MLDNSAVISWCFEDEANDYADAVLEKLTAARAIVPVAWALTILTVEHRICHFPTSTADQEKLSTTHMLSEGWDVQQVGSDGTVTQDVLSNWGSPTRSGLETAESKVSPITRAPEKWA